MSNLVEIESTDLRLTVRYEIIPGLKKQGEIRVHIQKFFQEKLWQFRPAVTFGNKEMHVFVKTKKGEEVNTGVTIDFDPLITWLGLREKPTRKNKPTATIKRKPLTTT